MQAPKVFVVKHKREDLDINWLFHSVREDIFTAFSEKKEIYPVWILFAPDIDEPDMDAQYLVLFEDTCSMAQMRSFIEKSVDDIKANAVFFCGSLREAEENGERKTIVTFIEESPHFMRTEHFEVLETEEGFSLGKVVHRNEEDIQWVFKRSKEDMI